MLTETSRSGFRAGLRGQVVLVAGRAIGSGVCGGWCFPFYFGGLFSTLCFLWFWIDVLYRLAAFLKRLDWTMR